MHVEFGFQDMHQTVIMLSMHASNKLKANDILAIGGLKIKDWQHERTLDTSFVNMVEVNLTRDIRCVCKMNIWSFGAQSDRRTAQSNVILIDEADRSYAHQCKTDQLAVYYF